MPAPSSPTTLYRIDECADLMADACIRDEQGNLIFISVWARDTAIQQFLARLTLSRDRMGWASSTSSPTKVPPSPSLSVRLSVWKNA